MLDVRYGGTFKKDFKLCKKRGYNLKLLQDVIDLLRVPSDLPEKNRDHLLTGNYKNWRECHVAPDWLLIYRYEENTLLLSRTGTHSDLFT